eukprot:Sdes_comp20810_c0_seq11m17199
MIQVKNVDEKSNFLQVLQGYLWKTLNITISDGRMFEGEFMCTDRDMNIVLSRCCEHRLVQSNSFLIQFSVWAFSHSLWLFEQEKGTMTLSKTVIWVWSWSLVHT